MTWTDHTPKSDLSKRCGYGELCGRVDCTAPVIQHRVDHVYKPVSRAGDERRYERAASAFGFWGYDELCAFYVRDHDRLCGLPLANHVMRITKKVSRRPFIGLDGEGSGRAPHRYTLLAAADHRIPNSKKNIGRKARRAFVHNPNGLTTEECLKFIMSLPRAARLFGFSLQYDLTKMLADLPDRLLFMLNHPETRTEAPTQLNPYPKPDYVPWTAPSGETYYLNLLQTKLSVYVKRKVKLEDGSIRTRKRRRVVWDIFRFFNKAFVKTLEDWGVGTAKVRALIERMKRDRGKTEWLTKTPEEMREYCLSECHYLAVLAKRLVRAFIDAGIPLKSFYSAGSGAGAMLKKLDVIKDVALDPTRIVRTDPQKPRSEMEKHLAYVIMQAFFGGRFENALVGSIHGPLYNFDISSAYPYQTVFLPCLLHGYWVRTTDHKRMRRGKTAVVRYALGTAPASLSWGPFPFRERDGTIVYPKESGGGWVWREEFLAGERLCSHVHFVEAYVLESDCDCQPFKDLPRYYAQRLLLGKEGAGLAFKTSLAALYGKLAQHVGSHKYQCFVWAGLTTSGTRAQLLDGVAMHHNRDDVLALATDSIISRCNTAMPEPRETGTALAKRSAAEVQADAATICGVCGRVACPYAHKPLGGWERKLSSGMFFARPGIYWDLEKHGNATSDDELARVRARGVGRSVLSQHVMMIRRAWLEGRERYLIDGETHDRFRGMRSSLFFSERAKGFRRTSDYGEWMKMPIAVSFSPLPKRVWPAGTLARSERVKSSAGDDWVALSLRTLPREQESVAHLAVPLSPEGVALRAAHNQHMEQPDPGDTSDYEEN